jgi:Asp-tRNA(Asn)/Glu-tRNA(Gln) amidotransferase A subunit family amidase
MNHSITSFVYSSAASMARLVRKKAISPVELIRAHLDRIEALNPALNAFVHVRHEEALRDAIEAEAAVMRGEERPLLGVPVSIKCCIDVAGLRCTAGSRLRSDYVAASDATLVHRLKNAGAIILGNTNAAEMLMAYDTENLLHGRTSNPWDLDCTPGGSSGGEAAAIASGMSAAGIGSDGGGSIRVPAHFSGICGLKPTPGRIPATGHFPASVGPFAMMGVVGPMARTIEDLRLVLKAIAGADIADPMAADYTMTSVPELDQVRVGFFEDDERGGATTETQAAVRGAVEALQEAGLHLEQFLPDELERARELWHTLFVRVAGGMLVAGEVVGRRSELSSRLKNFLEIAAAPQALTADELLHTLFARDELRAHLLKQMEKYQVLVAPVCTGPAFRHGEGGWDDGYSTNYIRDMRYSQWFNILGNPAAVVPVGRSPYGLPIGVQVIGRPYEEMLVLRVAGEIEKRFGWKEPPMNWAQAPSAREEFRHAT